MDLGDMKLSVRFFRSDSGAEPVRRWLKSLSVEQKKVIGEDIKTVQFGWPLGMPLVEKLAPHLWEVRVKFPNGIARVIFTVDGQLMVLLHGFIKKSQKIPQREMTTAKNRLKLYQETES
ncbi:MAG: type II toxin-antitoxin system RelE/ParE family toxin [Bacteroidales bacterium]|jgi:phage-related protein|nr:type II toxin-antitoxin system RelE/ParE family toxin [Bacteroidales bacterium]